MKFMLMMHGTRKGWEALSSWSPAEFKAHIEFMMAFNAKLASAGELVLAEGLDVPMNAKVVQAGKGGAAPRCWPSGRRHCLHAMPSWSGAITRTWPAANGTT